MSKLKTNPNDRYFHFMLPLVIKSENRGQAYRELAKKIKKVTARSFVECGLGDYEKPLTSIRLGKITDPISIHWQEEIVQWNTLYDFEQGLCKKKEVGYEK